MTTIACDRSSMAADSRFYEDGISFPCRKLFRFDGSIYGTAGETRGIGKFLAWVEAGRPDDRRPEFSGDMDDFCVLELNKDGIFYWDKHLYPCEVLLPYFAIGTGGDFARTLMSEAGMSPERAVAAVCDRNLDYASAGPVQVEHL